MIKNNLVGAILVFGFASSAVAADLPTQGTITVTGNVAPTFSITSADAADGALAETVTFSPTDLAVTDSGAFATHDVTFRLRSNANYKVTATVNKASGTSDVGPEDIGFAITSAAATGSLTDQQASRGATNTVDTIATEYVKTHGLTGTSSSDLGTAHLGTLATSQQLLNGPRISAKGGYNNPNNALDVTAEVAMLPQFFTAGDFNYVVTLTVANN